MPEVAPRPTLRSKLTLISCLLKLQICTFYKTVFVKNKKPTGLSGGIKGIVLCYCMPGCNIDLSNRTLFSTDVKTFIETNTVKLVYKDHPMHQQDMVLIQRWSLYAGSITLTVYLWGPVKCGLYKQVVFIYRWSLEQV